MPHRDGAIPRSAASSAVRGKYHDGPGSAGGGGGCRKGASQGVSSSFTAALIQQPRRLSMGTSMGMDVGKGGSEAEEGGGTSECRDGDAGGGTSERFDGDAGGVKFAGRAGEGGGGTSDPSGGRGAVVSGATLPGGEPISAVTRGSFDRSPASQESRSVGGVHMTASAIAEACGGVHAGSRRGSRGVTVGSTMTVAVQPPRTADLVDSHSTAAAAVPGPRATPGCERDRSSRERAR